MPRRRRTSSPIAIGAPDAELNQGPRPGSARLGCHPAARAERAPGRQQSSRLVVQKTVAPRIRLRTLAPPALPAVPPGPIVKWVGGKARLAAELLARAPRDYKRYFEPFAGGAALFFAMRPVAATLSDLNADLIATYRAVRGDVESVIAQLRRHRELHDEAHYYRTRERWNQGHFEGTRVAAAAAFIYLNKTCFNGLWRVNRRGEFNVPMGRYTNPGILDEAGLRASSAALGRAEILHAPFEHVLEEADAGDFVYFDPPYVPVSTTADFVSYTAEQFGEEDQARLARAFRSLADRGCAVMLSNSDTPLVRRLYAGFRIDVVRCSRAINSKADARGAVDEVIVTNRY